MTGNNPSPRRTAADKRRALGELLQSQRCVLAGSVFDPLSARVADVAGFEVGVLGGSLAALAVLGAPDIMLLTLTELAEQARRICRVSDVPVIVDADNGYGNALNVMRTVEELEVAGVSGLSIEDSALPRAFGAGPGELTSVEESAQKMAAAVAAARGTGLRIFGRTHALPLTGLDDAVERLKVYEQTGVDALFVPYIRSREQLERISAATRLPLIVGAPARDVVDLPYLVGQRARICLRGHQALGASVQALHDVARAVLGGVDPDSLAGLPPDALLRELSRASHYDALTDHYLKPR
jgi:carboxyvinyl-carboxyphosphonate phosphorylmutase